MLIRPSADLRNKYGELSQLCRDTMAPIEITVNGREDTVLINHTLYHQQMAELELLKAMAEAEEDIEQGRVKPAEEVFAELRKRISAL